MMTQEIPTIMFNRGTDTIKFGKHKGKTFNWLLKNEIMYLEWCVMNVDNFTMTDELHQEYEDAVYESDAEHYTGPAPHYSDW